MEREFAEDAGRVSFRWLNDLSLPEMQRFVASLPPNSAVFYGALYVDAAGVPHEQDGLPAICASSRSPVFGMYEEELGVGIVGGPLLSIKREARRASSVAVEILAESPSRSSRFRRASRFSTNTTIASCAGSGSRSGGCHPAAR